MTREFAGKHSRKGRFSRREQHVQRPGERLEHVWHG